MSRLGFVLRLVLLSTLAGVASVSAQTLAALPDADEVAALQCLTKACDAVQWDAATAARQGLIRVALRFTQADAAPVVSVISNTLGEAAERLVLARVSGYRLPCLSATLGAQGVELTQEFRSGASSGEVERPARLIQGILPASVCLLQPPANEVLQRLDRLPPDFTGRVMIQSRFTGGAEDAPQNVLLFSNAPVRLSDALMKRADSIRMVCRKPGDRPQTLRQSFVFEVGSARRKQPPTGLNLEGWMQLVRAQPAAATEFDFNSMRCPFEIEWRTLQPVAGNEARTAGRAEADRAEFLAWAGELRLAGGEVQEREWFGERMRIQVPCGVHLLRPGVGAERQR